MVNKTKNMPDKKDNKSYIFTINDKTSLPFSVDTIINMDLIRSENEKIRFTANLLGWARPDYLLTSASYESKIMLAHIGTKIIARYLFEGQIYGFATQLMYKQTDPTPLWFLNFPDQIEVINLRVNPRYPIVLEIKDQNGWSCFTKDISNSGVSIIYKMDETNLKKDLGDIMELNFKLPDGSTIKNLKAEIVRKYIDSNLQMLGVCFTKDNITELEKISNYLNKLKDIYNWTNF